MARQFLSKEEAINFVTTRLGADVADPDKFNLLRNISSRFVSKIPFQNITLMAKSIEDREIPTIEETVRSVLDGYGGLCFTLNTFMYLLLRELGYDVHLLLCSVAVPSRVDHVAILAKNVSRSTENDRWFVDVGFGFPGFVPINMDFEKESKTITESYLTYKFVKRGETYIRLHKDFNNSAFPNVEDVWTHALYFTLEPYDMSEISDSINRAIYTNYMSEDIWFHSSPRIITFESDMKAIVYKENIVLKEDENGKLHQGEIKGDVAEYVHQLFPMIPLSAIKAAIINFKSRNMSKARARQMKIDL